MWGYVCLCDEPELQNPEVEMHAQVFFVHIFLILPEAQGYVFVIATQLERRRHKEPLPPLAPIRMVMT